MPWLPWRRSRAGEARHPLARLRRDMEGMFDEFWRGWAPSIWGEGSNLWPTLDIRETDSEVVAELEVPGMKPGELDLTVTENALTIKGEKKAERDETEGEYHVTERGYGAFHRTVQLPAGVDADRAEARYKDGILTITLPKTEKSKVKKIEVK